MRIRLEKSPGYTLARTAGWPGAASNRNQAALCVSLLICACVGADRGEAEEDKDGHDENERVQVCVLRGVSSSGSR